MVCALVIGNFVDNSQSLGVGMKEHHSGVSMEGFVIRADLNSRVAHVTVSLLHLWM